MVIMYVMIMIVMVMIDLMMHSGDGVADVVHVVIDEDDSGAGIDGDDGDGYMMDCNGTQLSMVYRGTKMYSLMSLEHAKANGATTAILSGTHHYHHHHHV